MSNHFRTLRIRILAKQIQNPEAYPVEFILNEGEKHPQLFSGGALPANILPWINSSNPSADGQRLFAALFGDDAGKEAWHTSQTNDSRLQLELQLDAPELYDINWELLHYKEHYLSSAPNTPFSRYVPGSLGQVSAITPAAPLKILVAIANPTDLARFDGLRPIDVEFEQATLSQVFNQFHGLEYHFLPQPITLSNIQAELSKGYHILHLIAHGRVPQRDNQNIAIFLANEANEVARVSPTKFSEMLNLQQAKPTLVFLTSCDSGKSAQNLALELMKVGIPAVLAMQEMIAMDTARAFTHEFYHRLFEHGLVDLAVNQARAMVMTANFLGSHVPVLFSRLPQNQLLATPLKAKNLNVEVENMESPYGTMAANAALYVEREADEKCWKLLRGQSATTIAIHGARQTGKSSLMKRLQGQIEAEKLTKQTIFIDFQEFTRTDFNEEETFLKTLCEIIAGELKVAPAFERHWQSYGAVKTRCNKYLKQYLLPQIKQPLILALDEVDRLLGSPIADEFFGLLRLWHNLRSENNSPFSQVTLLLSIYNDPNRLIKNPNQSPFNVAHPIDLTDFSLARVVKLNQLHSNPLTEMECGQLFALLKGHPFLTRVALYELAKGNITLAELLTETPSSLSIFSQHLNGFRLRILQDESLKTALKQIMTQQRCTDFNSLLVLQDVGLVQTTPPLTHFRNKLYENYCQEWFHE